MKYKIKLPGLENVLVDGELSEFGLYITSIDAGNAGQSIPHGVFWAARSILEAVPAQPAERDYGEELYHAEFHKGGIDVAYARYKNVATVTVREAARGYERTLYAQNFWGEKADPAIKAVERVMRDGLDPDDLILELKENE